MVELTSLSLLARACDSDQIAWHRILYLYSPLISHWCRSCGVSLEDIDDIRQEVFASVSAKLGTFHRDRPGDTFRGWLRVITQHKIIDHRR